ncbi:MAG: hypothetical protein RR790_01905 [Eubacterium sp.]
MKKTALKKIWTFLLVFALVFQLCTPLTQVFAKETDLEKIKT